ncbi:MAG: TldD/PmbA family protein [Thermoplasmata archaeon]|jgi:PmbA protein|nr:TldD/PmbA family protein [Euryarchaeota archaeon]MVT35831.1 TldD/PmbA family protein [Euryarchaeota archaeon]
MVDTEYVVKKLLSLGADEVSVIYVEREMKQSRFSNSKIDIILNYQENSLSLFLSKGKKTFFTTIRNFNKLESHLEDFVKILNKMPENKDFVGLNTKKQSYRSHEPDGVLMNMDDLNYFSKRAIEGAQEKGAKRVAGVIYHFIESISLSTNYNNAMDKNTGLFFSVRAFNENGFPGQSAFHTSDHKMLDDYDPYFVGEEAADYASLMGTPKEGKEGKYDVLFHPLCFGSLISYSAPMASAYNVETGMSFFTDTLGKKIGSDELNLYDDPTMESGVGFRLFDDEGTETKKVPIIEKGEVKTYLHNFSTASRQKTETTGNAGIINPQPWQPVMGNGRRSFDDMIGDMKKGLFIVNTWYTRFQDYRNGDFSTIPRDGIFLVENGEIVESWKGIRISDNLPRIFSAIKEVSLERMQVKWWDEVMPSLIPYVWVENVNITKAR